MNKMDENKEHTDPWRENLKRDIARYNHAAAAASDDKSVRQASDATMTDSGKPCVGRSGCAKQMNAISEVMKCPPAGQPHVKT